MDDMDNSYAEMTNFFEKSLESVKNRISKKNEDGINDQKKLVSEVNENIDKFYFIIILFYFFYLFIYF